MSLLVTCPNCGPREVAGAPLRRGVDEAARPTPPTQRELNDYVYFRDNEWGFQREWWFCRVCEEWFLAERHTYTNEVAADVAPGAGCVTRLAPHPGELIDRSHELDVHLRRKARHAFRGDTIGSALYASGRRVFSRSFKYHRPRGLLCCSGHCANCQMTVDGAAERPRLRHAGRARARS